VYEPLEGGTYTYLFDSLATIVNSVETTWWRGDARLTRLALIDATGLPVTDRVVWVDTDEKVRVEAEHLTGELHRRAIHF
jgi:hypothetical protein